MISIIVAVSKNGVIGGENKLLWYLPEDLKRFKNITKGKPVIMGRKTFESIGFPLPSRTNFVITKNSEYKCDDAVLVYTNLTEAIQKAKEISEEVMIIGGDSIYKQVLNEDLVDTIYLTVVDEEFEGDSFFEFDNDKFKIVFSEYFPKDKKNQFDMFFRIFNRKK